MTEPGGDAVQQAVQTELEVFVGSRAGRVSGATIRAQSGSEVGIPLDARAMRYVLAVDPSTGASRYQAMTLAELAGLLAAAEDNEWWRYIAEFLEEYRWEPPERRPALLVDEPPTTGDERWDVLLAALAEHLAARDGRGAPPWSESRALRRFWFPFNTAAARADAIVNAPAAFRRRGVFLARQELEVA